MERRNKKITILGAGNVGATIAYTLTLSGTASEIVLVDVREEKAKGEVMDILQGSPFTPSVNLYSGDASAAANSDIVIVTAGVGRKPGQTRIELAQTNVAIMRDMIPSVVRYAPHAVYIVVSNPVDILTYAIIKMTGLPPSHVIGSGTILDTARLRSSIAEQVGISPRNVHAYVLGEHGDTAVFPWSLVSIEGMPFNEYCKYTCEKHNRCGRVDLAAIEEDVRTSGAKVISCKGATYYAISLSVRELCEAVLRDSKSVHTVSTLLSGEYGIENVAVSVPFILGVHGILGVLDVPLSDDELMALSKSADAMRTIIDTLEL